MRWCGKSGQSSLPWPEVRRGPTRCAIVNALSYGCIVPRDVRRWSCQNIARRSGERAIVDRRRSPLAVANRDGAPRDIVALNAGTALYADGLAPDIGSGMAMAAEAMASGAAHAKLEQFVRATQEIGGA